MKRCILLLLTVAVFSSMYITVYAQSAKVGDTVVVSTYISNQTGAASLSSSLKYDAEYLNLISAEVIYGSHSCNTGTSGEVKWATVFDVVTGMDFSEKTEVMTAVFEVKSDFDDINGLISNTVIDGYGVNLESIDYSNVGIDVKVTENIDVTPSEDSQPDVVQSKPALVISRYEASNNAAPVSSSGEKSSLESSDISSNSAGAEQSGRIEKESSEQSSAENSSAADSKMSSHLVIKDSELKGTPAEPLKEHFDKTENARLYIFGFVIGGAALVIIGLGLAMVKARHTNKDAAHMR